MHGQSLETTDYNGPSQNQEMCHWSIVYTSYNVEVPNGVSEWNSSIQLEEDNPS